MKLSKQHLYDSSRKYYELTFPTDMDEKKIHDFIRSIGSNLRGGASVTGVPSFVFETWVTARHGITHRIRVPENQARRIIGQLQHHCRGTDVKLIENEDTTGFQVGSTIHMDHPAELLSISNPDAFSSGVLASMQAVAGPKDALVLQWVITHSPNQKQPPMDTPVLSTRAGALSLLRGKSKAGHDELVSRRAKQEDQNYTAIGRIAARSETVAQARGLVSDVLDSLCGERGAATLYDKRMDPKKLSHDILGAVTPFRMTAQFNVSELGAVIGWPMSDRYVPGMTRGSTQHLLPNESIPHRGIVLGDSTMPGLDRTIAMSLEPGANMNTLIAGKSGSGKTNLAVTIARQHIDQGAGLVLVEQSGNLYEQVLAQVPPHRLKDVICVDLSRSDRPVGLNLLRLGSPSIVTSNLHTLLNGLYPEITSVYANQLVMYGVPVLANLPRATLSDLIPFAHPRTPEERAWVSEVIKGIEDITYQDFWTQWHKKDERTIIKDTQPLKNRLWEILTPEATRYLVNQETSSFDPIDVIDNNKLLFINLAGESDRAAKLIASMIIDAMWGAARGRKPKNPNYFVIDEFHQFGYLDTLRRMFAEGRKWNAHMLVATQSIDQLDRDLQNEALSNTATKIIFNSDIRQARTHASDFGRPVTPESFVNLKKYDAIARINTPVGISEPVTIHTAKAPSGYGYSREAEELSAQRYGRSIEQIKRDDSTRRRAVKKRPMRPLGEVEIGEDEDY